MINVPHRREWIQKLDHLISFFFLFCWTKVPEGLDRNLTLPRDEYLSRLASKASPDTIRYEECRMFVSPYNHSWGKKPCVYGYEFHVDGAEWTVVAEVRWPFQFILFPHSVIFFSFSGVWYVTENICRNLSPRCTSGEWCLEGWCLAT